MEIVNKIVKLYNPQKVSEVNENEIQRELYFIECFPETGQYLINLREMLAGQKIANANNSTIAYLLDITDEFPTSSIAQTPTTLPDIDYDTDGRDAIKHYLVDKYGTDHVTLLGTYNTLKTKGSVKDVIRQLKSEMNFEDVNLLTKKFDNVKRLDTEAIKLILTEHAKITGEIYPDDYSFSSEIAYFEACLINDPGLKQWFMENPDVHAAVMKLLGNNKSTGVHAGGIVVSRANIPRSISLSYSDDDGMYVTQPEMSYVESSGLVKYDFLGLKTLADMNLCLKLIEQRHGKKMTFRDIPVDDDHVDHDVLSLFVRGYTESIFQFNTNLSVSILTKLPSVDNVNDLAIITSIARPGPLKMKMDVSFINRKNGTEPIKYLHHSLESILKDTYGIICYQEQVMMAVQSLGGLSRDESVVVLKAMGKKDLDKLVKFKGAFLKNSLDKYPEMADLVEYFDEATQSIKMIPLNENIWQYLVAFAEYGFNRSHAIAYSCVSYLSMWFKKYYGPEWKAAVLSGADKEDFKILYQQWKEDIRPPSINLSKDRYIIDDEQRVIMPFFAVNGIGDKVVEAIVAAQPFVDFEDFFSRVDKRKVTKQSMVNLILSGCMDILKPNVHYSENKWRKELLIKLFTLREKIKKSSKAEREEIDKYLEDVKKMTKGEILMKELSLLNFTSFDYHEYFYDQMTLGAKQIFGQEAMRPEQIADLPNKKTVVVGGSVESIMFYPVKNGKDKGKDMAKIILSNEGKSCEVTVFASVLEQSDKGKKTVRKIKEYTPIVVKGKTNHWNGNVSVSYDECWILINN